MDGVNTDRGSSSCSDRDLNESSRLRSLKVADGSLKQLPQLGSPKFDLSNFSVLQNHGLYQYPYTMNALEILRETIRILRSNAACFMIIAAVFICPVSALLLSNALVNQSIVKRLVMRLLLVARSSGLPLNHLVKQTCIRFSEMIISNLFCFPFFITFSLTSKAAIVYSVACTYASKRVVASDFCSSAAKIWKRVVSTYIWVCVVIASCIALFIVLLIVICNLFSIVGYPSEFIVYPALVVAIVFSVAFAHTIIICNLTVVITILEEVSGSQALFRSVFLIKDQTHVGLIIFLGSTIGMALVEGLFEHRVKTLSYGDGSSRIWEGPLLVIMYSFVVLIDSMMSAVFYFTCRSSSMGTLEGDYEESAELDAVVPESGETS
ncbi:hypothetical protein H6P81_014571 [Aristolochia fimbriata]|uniref:Son of sevenless n=1 Tax=Aristolochia fimbriata TaxID=158543 RepID=A0AAV7E5U9_ARIFI|nr:hypothetical protein H6P81_014571 [Aristolochia fimbriata]